MALVVFVQEDEDVLSVYCSLKIFCETAPWHKRVDLTRGVPLKLGCIYICNFFSKYVQWCMKDRNKYFYVL